MQVRHVVLVAAIAALAGCGGGDDSAVSPTTTATTPTESVRTDRLSLGCDVVAQCFPDLARATLERCPENRLDARGRKARRRLETLLARIADVDLHNEQAYEASDAAIAAIAGLEEECL